MKTIITVSSILGLILMTTLVLGDNDKDEENEYKGGKYNRIFSKQLDVAIVKNTKYKEECGSCHFAYQPGLLPARSWEKMMANLDNHFDENAELDKETQTELTTYLITNAADHADYKRSQRIMGSLSKNDTPLRITETPYFLRKHNEIPRKVIENNPKLSSFSQCAACHVNAEKGSYDEDEVRIPGVGKWED
jgi:ferredoxin